MHVMPFCEFGFFLIVVSMNGCFADEFADGTPHHRAMLVHAVSSALELTDASYSQRSQMIKPLYG